MLSKSSDSMQMLKLRPAQEKRMAWLDMGEDVRLSTKILKRIEKRLKVKSQK